LKKSAKKLKRKNFSHPLYHGNPKRNGSHDSKFTSSSTAAMSSSIPTTTTIKK
jgi:hypothetical protein